MRSLVLATVLATAAAMPAQAASVISLGAFDNPFTGSFSAMAEGSILGGEAPGLDPSFAALGFTSVTAFGADPDSNGFNSSIVGLGASGDNEPMIVGPSNPESLIELIIAFGRETSRFAFSMEASEFTEIFTIQFTSGGSLVDDFDVDTTGGPAPNLVSLALEADTSFDGVRFTGLDKAVFASFTVETPSQVPLPGGLALLLAGLGGLTLVGKSRRG